MNNGHQELRRQYFDETFPMLIFYFFSQVIFCEFAHKKTPASHFRNPDPKRFRRNPSVRSTSPRIKNVVTAYHVRSLSRSRSAWRSKHISADRTKKKTNKTTNLKTITMSPFTMRGPVGNETNAYLQNGRFFFQRIPSPTFGGFRANLAASKKRDNEKIGPISRIVVTLNGRSCIAFFD